MPMRDLFIASFDRFTQDSRLMRLTTPLGSEELLVECVRGEEAISAGFTFTISALSLDAGISLRALLGQPALLELLTVHTGQLRPFHGYLTAVKINSANGGMARYTLTLQPWSAFMGPGRDSRVFQDMTVFDILDAVFHSYQGRGKLAPEWRFDIADRSVYPARSLTTQYQESDLAFAERLMSEEGLFYFYEHLGDAHSPSRGSHAMVVADHNGAFKPNVHAVVRYTQPGAVMKEDSMDRWRREMRLQTNAIELWSWDYRSLDSRPVSVASEQHNGTVLVSSDVPGAYAYSTRSQGQRIAENQLQALEARREVFTGAGTVRTLSPGTTFTLAEHAMHDQDDNDEARRFMITRTVHLMHNNLNAELVSDVNRRIGAGALASSIADEQSTSLHAFGSKPGERPIYRNRIDAIRAKAPFRASRTGGRGELLHPRPTVCGQQTAVVVGPPGATIHTDRDHRVKVQFHWQRDRGDGMSHSRLSHPAADGHAGAPADDRAGTWVRVATPFAPIAGANWGGNAVPRIGQEVLIDFLDGDIDRPVIIGALYNGRGQTDSQGNQVPWGAGAATGNAPAWFPGDTGAHAHPAVLSGFKSQALQTSQDGTGSYSQLVFDDSPGQSRVGLQRHARQHQGTDELNLGHLRHQTDNQRLQAAGFGAELKTANSTALRAGKGMLLSTDLRVGASGTQMDSREAHSQILASLALLEALAGTTQKHNAKLKDQEGADEVPAEKMRALAELASSCAVVAGMATGAGTGDSGGNGGAPVYTEAQLQLSARSGIAAATPANAILQSCATSSISAGQDINFASQGSSFNAVGNGVSLFTYGKATNPEKPNQETGIALHTASGKFSSQSQTGATQVLADKTVTVASVTKSINVSARRHVLLTAQGAFIKLEGGNIQLHCPGKVSFKASLKELGGPVSATPKLPHLPKPIPAVSEKPPLFSQQFDLSHLANNNEFGFSSNNVDYRILDKQGNTLASGTTDEAGLTDRILANDEKDLVLIVGSGDWQVEEHFEFDDDSEPAGATS